MEAKTNIKHDMNYYSKCFFAGLFPCGLTHTLLTPLDIVKCRRQVRPELYTSLKQGLNLVFKQNGIRGLYLGWQPTIIGYSLQGSFKYGFYEIFKDFFNVLDDVLYRLLVEVFIFPCIYKEAVENINQTEVNIKAM